MTDINAEEFDGSAMAEQNPANEHDPLITEDRVNSTSSCQDVRADHRSTNGGETFMSKLLLYFNSNSLSRPLSPESPEFAFKPNSNKIENKYTIYNYLHSDEVRTNKKFDETEVRFENSQTEADRSRRTCGKKSTRRKLLNLLVKLSVCIVLLAILSFLLGRFSILPQREADDDDRSDRISQSDADTSSRWVVSSSKCHIPQLDAWHESIEGYVKRKPPMNCRQVELKSGLNLSSLSYAKGNRLHLSHAAPDNGGCCTKRIRRKAGDDDSLLIEPNCAPINESTVRPPSQYVKVECPSKKYTNVHSFIVPKEEDEKSLDGLAKKKLIKDEHYNIIMLGMDTISRLNGYRQLNGTLDLLRKRYKTIEFFGYNKVGENTFPNLIPLLTGLKPEQLSETGCWLPTDYSADTERGDDYLDNCRFLWNFYRNSGYRTYYSEDWPKASTFNYIKKGFKNPPTSFYNRPATIARDGLLLPPVGMGCASCIYDRPLVEIDLTTLKAFVQEYHKKPFFAFHWINCPHHDDLNGASQVDHIVRKFFQDIHRISQNERTFVIFFSDHGYRWDDFVSTRIGHYESSLPMMTIAPPRKFIEKHPDLYENLKSHARALITPFDLFKTLVDIRNLGSNHIKSKKAVGQKHNISKTSSQISSAKTTHSPTTSTKEPVLQDGLTFRQSFSTLSLLAKHNSTQLDRSCIDAGIPDNFCVCHEFKTIDLAEKDVLGASYYLVYVHFYNRLRNNDRICHLLDLDKVTDARVFDLTAVKAKKLSGGRKKRSSRADHVSLAAAGGTTTPNPSDETTIDERHYLPNREYNVRVSVKPSGGLFQEVIRFYGDNLDLCKKAVEKASKIVNDSSRSHGDRHASVIKLNEVCKFSIHSASISRLNLYGDQSKCVENDIELKKICYCKN